MRTTGKDKTGIFLDSIVSPLLSEKDVGRARRVVAHHSVGVEECAQLLDMLGLNFTVDEIEST